MLSENIEKFWEKIKIDLDLFRNYMNFFPIIALHFYFGLTLVYTLWEIKAYYEVKHKKNCQTHPQMCGRFERKKNEWRRNMLRERSFMMSDDF